MSFHPGCLPPSKAADIAPGRSPSLLDSRCEQSPPRHGQQPDLTTSLLGSRPCLLLTIKNHEEQAGRWPGGQVLSASPTPAGFPLPCPAFSFPTLMSFRVSSLPPPQGPHLPTYLPTYSSSNKQTNKNPFPNPLLPSPDSRSLAYPAALHRSPSRPPHAHCTLDFRLPSAPNWL